MRYFSVGVLHFTEMQNSNGLRDSLLGPDASPAERHTAD